MLEHLTLIRHAKALPGTLSQLDKSRGLTPQGARDAFELGIMLRERNFTADVVLCSSATRTRETLMQLTAGFEKQIAPVRYMDALYHASAGTIMEEARMAEEKRVVIIGHNPGMTDLAGRIAQCQHAPDGLVLDHFPPAGCASFNISKTAYTFDFFIVPNLVRLKEAN